MGAEKRGAKTPATGLALNQTKKKKKITIITYAVLFAIVQFCGNQLHEASESLGMASQTFLIRKKASTS